MKKQTIMLLGVLLFATLACRFGTRAYENDTFSFTIPSGWRTSEEVWDRPRQPEKEYYGLGVQEIITLQYPSGQGKGKAFFSVAASPLTDNKDLETHFTLAYQNAIPEVEDVSIQLFERGPLSGHEIFYRHPWGEPWWQFHDIWLEKAGMVYVISFHAAPNAFETYADTYEQTLDSFQFKK